MTDADTDGVVETIYKGQVYRRIGEKPHMRVDGTMTRLAIWESCCPVCGATFTMASPRFHKLREPNRRCPEHRAPGRRVVLAEVHVDVATMANSSVGGK